MPDDTLDPHDTTSPSPNVAKDDTRDHGLLALLGAAAVTFLAWRGSLFLFDLLGLSLTPSMGRCRKQWEVFGKGHEFLNGFFRWDAGWYGLISRSGYSFHPDRASSVAFYPLYPYLARYLGKVIGSAPVAGLIISNLATLGAVFYLRRLGALLFGDPVGKLASILLLVFPTSLFLSSFYTEGLFVCLATASMFYFFRRQYLWAGLIGFFAMLTRSTGLVLFAAQALDLCVRLLQRREKFHPRMLALLFIPMGLGVFMLILKQQVGDPFAFATTLEHWGRERAWPWQSLFDAFRKTDFGFAPNFAKTQRFIDASLASSFLVIGLSMAITKKGPIALSAYVVLGVLLPLCTYNLSGMNRYVLGLFPAFLFIAQLCERRPELGRWVVYASSFFLALYSLRFMQCGWAG